MLRTITREESLEDLKRLIGADRYEVRPNDNPDPFNNNELWIFYKGDKEYIIPQNESCDAHNSFLRSWKEINNLAKYKEMFSDIQQSKNGKYLFRLPIGDWSNDGHGKCDYYIVESNKSVEEIREIHFLIKEITGIDLHNICNNYEENYIYNDVYDQLLDLGFEFNLDDDEVDVESYDVDEGYIIKYYLNSNNLLELWIFLLTYVDKTLEINIINNDIPILPFYGFDNQGRHIGFVGYGVFTN